MRHLSLVLVLGCAEPTSLEHRAAAVTAGTEDLVHDAVVKVLRDGVFTCSGTVIAPRVVLTAAHCLDPASRFTVVLDTVSSVEASAVPHPRFGRTGTADDIGVLVTTTPLPVVPMPVVTTRDGDVDATGYLRVVGFGQALDESAGMRRRSGTVAIAAATPSVLFTTAAPAQACAGDSGGPLLATIDGIEHVAGVASTSANGCTSTATATRVGYYVASFTAPIAAAVDGELRAPGERCQWDGQCATARCGATEVFGLALCTQSCITDADCDDGTCSTGTCAYATDRYALGATCGTDDDCASGLCNDRVCTQPCSRLSEASCPVGFACVDERGGAECHIDDGGCQSTRGGTLGLALVVLAVLRRRRILTSGASP